MTALFFVLAALFGLAVGLLYLAFDRQTDGLIIGTIAFVAVVVVLTVLRDD